MAGTITHAYFAKDVVKITNKKRKILCDDEYLNVFAQSMDPFNFYSILFPIKPLSSKIRKFSSVFHCSNTNQFFYTLINYIKDNKLTHDTQVMSLLYGFITHYVLDSMIHPYVEYKTGKFDVNRRETYKYNAKHHEMETYLDEYVLQKNNIVPQKYKSYKTLFNIDYFNENLIKAIDFSFDSVYNFKDFSKYYFKAIKDMRFCFRTLRYDPIGYKKHLYNCFDMVSSKKILNSKFLSYSYVPKNASIYLNEEHKYWHYPYDKNVKYNYSFDDIYSNALINV